MLKVKTADFRQARINEGLSCADLAKLSGVCTSTICRLEKGFSTNPGTAKKLADTLKQAVTDLFEIADGAEGRRS